MPLLSVLRKSPFARLLFFYASGITAFNSFSSHRLDIFGMAGVLALLWTGLLLVVIFYRDYNTGWIAGVLAALILFLCGIWAAEIQFSQAVMARSLPLNPMLYKIRIIDLPESMEHNIKATARVLAVQTGNRWTRHNLRIMVYISGDNAEELINPGTELIVNTVLNIIPDPGNPGEFDYGRYLAARHIYRQAYIKAGYWSISGSDPGKSLRAYACLMRKGMLKALENIGLKSSEYGLVAALTLGYKEDLDARTKQIFSHAGVMHIMALSGFNVGIIALVLGFVLGIFDFNPTGKIVKTLIVVLFLWLFALVTGLSPSVTRATVMISFILSGRLFHRSINNYNILFASAFVLLALSPGMLADVSFQLSFAAVAGIILYQPVLNNLLLFRNKCINKIWQLFTVTCAAQLATFPITLSYFHQFPVYFWLTNLYVVPLVSLIVCLAGIYLALAFIQPLALFLGKILAMLLKALYFSVAVVEHLPFSLIDGIYISGTQAVILIMMLLALALLFHFRQAKWIGCFLLMFIVYLSLRTVNLFIMDKQRICMVGSIRGETAINLIWGRESWLILGSTEQISEARLSYAFGNYWLTHGVQPIICGIDSAENIIRKSLTIHGLYCRSEWRGKNGLISFGGRRLVILRDNQFYRYRSSKPLAADMLVITGSLSVKPYRIAKEIQPRLIILDSSVKNFQAEQWKSACEKLDLQCYSVAESGAYILNGN